jgi:putative transposase
VLPDAVQLPRLGRLRLKERDYLPSDAKILSTTVRKQARHWYVTVLVDQERIVPVNRGPMVGVDLGIKWLATLSDGAEEPNPRHLKGRLRKITRCQRAVSRKRKGSRNRGKAVCKQAALHRTVANQHANTLHQFTSRLAKTKSVVVFEDLNVAGMLKNHRLAQAIGDVGFAEFQRHLTYKAVWHGCQVIVAVRWEPSSTTCSRCRWRGAHLTLADRSFRCQACGLVLDRDPNAAINLRKLAGSSPERQYACGVERSGLGLATQVKLSPLKQEPDTRYPSEIRRQVLENGV